MEKFLYVFSKDSRDLLLAAGYTLLKGDEKSDLYVFLNQADMTFNMLDMTFVRSNVLTF